MDPSEVREAIKVCYYCVQLGHMRGSSKNLGGEGSLARSKEEGKNIWAMDDGKPN